MRLGGVLVSIFDEDGFNVIIHIVADLTFGHVKAVRPVKVDVRELFA